MLKSDTVDAVLSIIPDFRSPLHPDTEVFEAVQEARQQARCCKPAAMWLYMTHADTEAQFETIDGRGLFPLD